MFKRLVVIMVSIGFLLSVLSTPAFARENLIQYAPDDVVVESNEFTTVNNKIKQYEQKLSMNRTLEEREIEEYNKLLKDKQKIIEFIYQQKNLSVEELQKQNYTNVQIEAIKNYDGSDEMSTLASARVVVGISCREFYYDTAEGKTYASIRFSGYWSGTPVYRQADDTVIILKGSDNNSSFIRYSSSNKIYHSDGTIVSNTTRKVISGQGVIYRFGIANVNGEIMNRFVMDYVGVASGRQTIIGYEGHYLHYHEVVSVSSIDLGVNVGSSDAAGSFNVSFSINKTYTSYSDDGSQTSYFTD